MEKKCICLIRVSTESQDLEQQKNEVFNLAKQHGYNKIIPIEDKESAVKLDEMERQGLNKMKEQIEKDNSIDCLFVYEISRISRKADIVYNIRNYCQKRHIQIIICKPSITVFKDNWDIDENANLMFSLFAAMAENEGFIRKERLARGKKQAAKLGKNTGGILPFGYYADNNNVIQVDEEQANQIRTIFALMATGKYSSGKLWEEMTNRGLKMTKRTFYNLLKNEMYCGIKPKKNKLEKPIKPIITEEIFYKAQQALNNNSTNQSKESKHHYLGNKLVVCPKCGRHYVINKNTYKCICRDKDSVYIATKVLDGILWTIAKQKEIDFQLNMNEEKENEIKTEIAVLNNKIVVTEKRGAEIEEKKARVREAYFEMEITKEERNKRLEKLDAQDADRQKQIADFKNQIEILNLQLSAIQQRDFNSKIEDVFANVSKIESEKQMSEIVHRHIIKVELSKYKEGEKVIKIDISFIGGTCQTLYYYPYRWKDIRIEAENFDGQIVKQPQFENYIYRKDGKVYDLDYYRGNIATLTNEEAQKDAERIANGVMKLVLEAHN